MSDEPTELREELIRNVREMALTSWGGYYGELYENREAYVAEQKAQAWDEGNAAGWNDGQASMSCSPNILTPNPYRQPK